MATISRAENVVQGLEVFFAYSRRDNDLRELVDLGLITLKRNGEISTWYDGEIAAGAEWEPEILGHLESADIILLLVSNDFIASDYIYKIEMKRAIERHKKKTARVIPIIAKPCQWKQTPLGALQALPDDGRPITKWSDRDEAVLNIADAIRRVIGEISPGRTRSSVMEVRPVNKGSAAAGVAAGCFDSPLLHTCSGLRFDKPPIERGCEFPFQDFSFDEFNNPVSYLWADLRGKNKIEASLIADEQKTPVLRIAFRNDEGTWPSNIALLPQGLIARKRLPDQRYLAFEALSVERSRKNSATRHPVVVAVRIIDGYLQHWEYTHPFGEYHLFDVSPLEYTRCAVDLADTSKWRLFNSDGNRFGPQQPLFELICGLVIEVGRKTDAVRAGHGMGEVCIRNIRLASDDAASNQPDGETDARSTEPHETV